MTLYSPAVLQKLILLWFECLQLITQHDYPKTYFYKKKKFTMRAVNRGSENAEVTLLCNKKSRKNGFVFILSFLIFFFLILLKKLELEKITAHSIYPTVCYQNRINLAHSYFFAVLFCVLKKKKKNRKNWIS